MHLSSSLLFWTLKPIDSWLRAQLISISDMTLDVNGSDLNLPTNLEDYSAARVTAAVFKIDRGGPEWTREWVLPDKRD